MNALALVSGLGHRFRSRKSNPIYSAHWFAPEMGITVGTAPRTIHVFWEFSAEAISIARDPYDWGIRF
jgi:hypothetical protein